MDEIAEKQRQREQELEERERLRREAILGSSSESPVRPSDLIGGGHQSDSGTAAAPAAAATATAALSTGKYVPKFKQRLDNSGQAPPPESDRWGNGRADERSQPSDRWRNDDRQPTYGFGSGSGSRSSWSSSRR